MTGTVGMTLPQRLHDRPRRVDDMPAELRGRQEAGPGVEQHHRLGAGLDLRRQVADCRLGQQRDQPIEQCRLGIRHGPRRGEIPRAAALHHVAGDGEWRAGEADQRAVGEAFLGQSRSEPAARFPGSARSPPAAAPASAPGDPASSRNGGSTGPSPSRYSRACPSAQGTIRMSLNRIAASKPIAADRLQRHFRRQVRRRAKCNEIGCLRPQRAILRQIAARLAHQPDRRRPDRLAGQCPQQGLRCSLHGHRLNRKER